MGLTNSENIILSKNYLKQDIRKSTLNLLKDQMFNYWFAHITWGLVFWMWYVASNWTSNTTNDMWLIIELSLYNYNKYPCIMMLIELCLYEYIALNADGNRSANLYLHSKGPVQASSVLSSPTCKSWRQGSTQGSTQGL